VSNGAALDISSGNRTVIMSTIEVHALTPERWKDFETLFGRGGAYGGCWCMWPRLRSKDWSASRSTGRKEAIKGIVESGEPPGLLAYEDGEPAGWVSLDRRERLEHYEYSRNVKSLDRPAGLWSIVCFVIGKHYRGQGMMRRLLDAAVAYAGEQGAQVIEAYPVVPSSDLKSYQGFEGIASVFERAGFVRVGGTESRPVMRKVLA
jgi:GNAT superfamily N-acetyltransferase